MTKDPTLYLTPNCTLVYPNIFEPASFKNEEPAYSATFLIAKSNDISGMREAVKAAATQKWGQQILSKMGSLRFPVRDGDEKAVDENGNLNKDNFYYNQHFIRAKSKWQPPVVNIYNDPITNENEIYGGCIVRAYFSFFGYDFMGNKGIGCGLRAVCKIEDGEPIGGGRINTAEVFNSVLQEKEKFTDTPPGYQEEKIGGYGQMGEPFPGDRMEGLPMHGDFEDSVPF